MTVGANKKKAKAQKSKKDPKAANKPSVPNGAHSEGKDSEQEQRDPDEQPFANGAVNVLRC